MEETFIGIVIFLIALAFWRRILTGIIGALILGFIGSFFGSKGSTIGAVLGFLIGITAKEQSENENEQDFKQKSTQNKQKSTPPPKSGSSKQSESRIIRCPTCKKKIRVTLPLRGNKGKCVACSSSFNIRMESNGQIKVEATKNESRSNTDHGTSFISAHYKTLEIEPTASPVEVRAAYKKKIREYHPDRVSGLGEKLRKMAEEESKLINKAYSILKSKGLAT